MTRMPLTIAAFVAAYVTGPLAAFPPWFAPANAAERAKAAKPEISEVASAALLRMGQTLRAAEQFSFRANTIRVYSEANGQPLHIFLRLEVTVHRPNRMLGEISGDDGSAKLFFDGRPPPCSPPRKRNM
jgi:hypothetical protein